jgi:hypothetical protein
MLDGASDHTERCTQSRPAFLLDDQVAAPALVYPSP